MNKIKFSHHYAKTPVDLTTFKSSVISVCVVDMEKLPIEFLFYDTCYYDEDGIKEKHYPLDFKTGIIITIFTNGYEEVWTTIRRWTPQKERYYMGMIGQEVEIEITEEKG